MAILVTGGAGYIGSHTVLYLTQQNEKVIVLDSLQTGHKEAILETSFYKGSIADGSILDEIFSNHTIDAVIHFAADSLVGESMKDPLLYYENNVMGTFTLIKKMMEFDIKKIVFSSSAAVYGNPEKVPIDEEDSTNPTNPYGETKLVIENFLKWCDTSYGLKTISLRYFNAAGADPEGRIGEDHTPESHLIPIVLQAALGKREKVVIFGDDYNTHDGTCVRDFVHVLDLASAHYLALMRLRNGHPSSILNLGNGTGFSVNQVVEACRKITGKNIFTEVMSRRPGDPARLIANSEKAIKELGWKPVYSTLETIVEHAWNWHRLFPNGFSPVKKNKIKH
ncbi:UDP-glucose 4-epimerase GalE [Fictibacillus nanhaiensis]|uniref:UDP-glucose 4-epimerase GalE n=1 Tax=Fictibacillus nanhaiensis TaxID=742169 RepID=UPI001C982F39|nr:UDP-glucose 4-epimerase GalE [Fictibacillus nanhaiensis]MBY6035822.1 UDP-glucose 4-epimerase GalE [Fictibacillus nanhaiensis]